MPRTLKNIIFLTIPTLIVLAVILEIFFRIGIPACNRPRTFFDEETLVYRFMVGEDEGLFTIGPLARQRGRWHINNAGWNNPTDYEAVGGKSKVAVIGDSYIEAFQVDIEKSYPALVNAALEDIDVYSFGVSGAPLSQHLHMSRHVARVFDPETLIISLTMNDFPESIYPGTGPHWLTLRVRESGLEEVQPRRNPAFTQYSRTKQILRHSALARYAMFNLDLKRRLLLLLSKNNNFEDNVDLDKIQRRRDEIGSATQYVMNQIRLENPDRRIIYVINGPMTSIYAGTSPSEEIRFIYEIAQESAKKADAEFLNLWPLMQERFDRDGIKFNSEYDTHWNEYGHAFVAEKVLQLLNKNPASKR